MRDNQVGLDDQADSAGPAPENDKVQVEQVNPDLVARDDERSPYGVSYEAVNVMLLNEFLKEHRKVEEQGHKEQQLEATIAQQQKHFDSTTEQQQKEMKALAASLNEQVSQIEKVSDQLEPSKGAQRVIVVKNQ